VPAKAKRRIMMTGSIASSAGRSQATRRRGRIASQNCFQQSSSIVGCKRPTVSMDISINPKEISMTTLNIGKHLVPLEHIVLVEPFDPSTQTRMRTDKAYPTRVYLLDRETILAEEPLATFVEKHSFRRLSEDGIAANGNIFFRGEAYEAQEDFKTNKLWRGPDGQSFSKLLLASPENALAVIVRGETDGSSPEGVKPNVTRRPPRRRTAPVPR
jgi:hypothetical protein